MNKKQIITLITIPLIIFLAACSSLNIPGIGGASTQAPGQGQDQNRAANFDPSKMPVEQKLAIGTLKLEGTDQAITTEQAKTLLPLWKAVKSLGTSNTTTTDEINALYKQIEDSMTPDQVKAIQDLTWKQDDLRTMAQQYGVQFGGSGGQFANLTPEQRATRVAQFQQNNGGTGGNRAGGNGGFPGGGGAGGGFPGGGFPGGGQGNGGQTNNGQPAVQRTPGANGARRAGGLNLIFADPVIKLLEQKTGAASS